MGNNSHTIHLSPSEIYTILRLGGCEATHTPSGVSARFYRQGDLQTCPVLSSLFLSTGFLPDEFSEIIGSEGVDFTKILVVTESRLTDEAKRKLVEFFGPKASEIKVGSLEIGGRCIRLNLRNKKGGHYKSTYELFNRDFNPPESYRESLKEWRRRLHDEFRSLQAEERHDKARKEDRWQGRILMVGMVLFPFLLNLICPQTVVVTTSDDPITTQVSGPIEVQAPDPINFYIGPSPEEENMCLETPDPHHFRATIRFASGR